MKKVLDFLKSHKYFLIWSVCYVCATWAILYFMFKFNIFNGAQWHRLAHAHLRGFPGFVFGILILAMIPLYVATSALIIRTKQPLITIPIPKIKLPKFRKKTDTNTNTTDADTPPETHTDTREIPDEIRHAFLHTKYNIEDFKTYSERAIQPAEPTPNTEIPSTTEPDVAPDADLPLPDDFDFSFEDDAQMFSDTPVFTSINFDEPASTQTTPCNKLIEHLSNQGITFTIIDNTIITDMHAIITHDDDDFWAVDDDNWFATGKSKPSPIKKVTAIAHEHNVTPAIYLASTNILDLDSMISKWESDGITVITNLENF